MFEIPAWEGMETVSFRCPGCRQPIIIANVHTSSGNGFGVCAEMQLVAILVVYVSSTSTSVISSGRFASLKARSPGYGVSNKPHCCCWRLIPLRLYWPSWRKTRLGNNVKATCSFCQSGPFLFFATKT